MDSGNARERSVPVAKPGSGWRKWAAALLLVAGVADTAQAQIVRNFTSRFSRTDRGNYLFVGNTLMTCPDAASACANARIQAGNATNNQDFTMVNVDVDAVEAGANSSTAVLTLPSGSTVRWAGLYWGASSSSAARNIAKLRTPASATYNTITATQLDLSGTLYHAFADVTSLITAGGSGSYTVADVKATTGTNAYAGWGLVVVYSDSTEIPHNVTVFDGFAVVQSGGGSADATVSGFVTPPSGTVNTKVGFLAYEGDFSNPGDKFSVNATALTNATNAANNVFNSTISILGTHVTTKTPNYLNQLGFDLDTMDATGLIANSATSAALQFGAGSDNYYPGVLVFSTDVYQPLLAPNFTKTVTDLNGGLVTPGDVLEYVVSVSNTGNDAADSVVLTDAIPANTTYVAGSLSVLTGSNAGTKTDATGDDQANYDSINNRVVFRLGTGATSAAGGSLAAAAATSIRFRVTIDGATANGTTISNSAGITYIEHQLGGTQSITSNTTASTISLPDLTIAKSHSGSFVRGSTGTYSVVVGNSGLGSTTGTVTVSDTLPSGLTPTTATGTGWSCGIASQTVTCSRSDALAVSGNYPAISIAVAVGQAAAASLTNTATVSGGGETNTANNSSGDSTTIVSSADVSVTKTGSTSAIAGGNVTYTVTVTNNGPSNAASVSVADPTPSGLTFVSNTGACTTAYPCSLGTLASGASAVITTTYSLPGNYASPSTITNTATVSTTTTDPTSSNNSATATTPVTPSTDLSVSKTGPASVTTGDNVVYTVTVSNVGGLAAATVIVSDTTPSGLTFVSNSGACTTAYPCSLGTVAAGATATITTTYAVPAAYTTPTTISNTASVSSSTIDHTAGNNSATATTSVSTSADVAITKTGPASVTTGNNLVYTVTVTNNGTSDAQAVSVADPTPSGLTFVSNSGNCTTAYPCSLGTVPAGATRTITSTYSVPSSYTTPSPIVNTATVSTTTTDPTSSNNSATSSTPVLTRADLAITKTGPASALAGNNVVYTVTVTNNGTSDALAVSVADPTPTNLTFVSNTGACTTAYPCSLGTVAAGATRTITTTYSLPSNYSTPSTITNTATVSSTTSDPAAANNSATASTPVTPSTDLSIAKTGPASVTTGTNVVYTVTVSNIGNLPASSVSVADTTPAGLTFVSNSGACTSAYPCSLGTIAASGTATITSTYSVPASYSGANPILNTATVSTSTVDQQSANNTSTASTPVTTSADLAITKTGPASVMTGTNLVYTVTVTNNGTSDASSVSVADTTPGGLTFVSNTGNCATAYPCSLGTIPAGATRTITSTYSVPASYTTPSPILNTATVSSATSDPTSGNNSSTSSTPVVTSADLAITKTGPASALAGNNVVYTVTVTNNGTSDAAGVSVADPTPTNLTFVSNTGACTTAYPCSLGTVAAGATRTITTTYSLPANYATPTTITNTATVSATTADPASGNNSATATTPVTPSADVSISKTGPASVTTGTSLVYTVAVTNNGPNSAAAVSVADTTPAGLTFVSNSGACTSAYPCSLGTIASGATATITTTYSVPSSYTSPNPIVNTATVSTTTADQTSANNTSTASTPVSLSADLAVAKTGPASVTAGTNLVYSVTVANNGTSDASAVSVADPTPAGLTFVSNAGDCVSAYPCSLGTIASGGSRTITTTYSVPASYLSPDPILNTATVSSATPDPVVGNDSDTESTPLVTSADLDIVKTGPASAVAGSNIVYTVVVTNNGVSDAAAVSVADTTPTGLVFVSNTGACTTAYPCSLGTIAAGGTRTITTTYSIPLAYGSPDPILNTATVSSSTGDPVSGNNSSTSSTPLTQSTDLSITKAGPVSVTAGEDVVYTIVVSNNGGSAAVATSVADPAPAGLVFVSNAGDCTTAFPCSLGSVGAGTTRTITSTWHVPSSYTAPDPIVNTATVSTSSLDTIPGNDSDTESTPVTISADLELTNSGPASVTAGTDLAYTVTVTNNGSSDATGVVVADPTPTGLTFVSNAGDCATAYPCSLGTVPAGATRTITTTYAVPAAYTSPDPIVNTATVSASSSDPVAGNNSDTESTPLVTSADVEIVKSGPATVTAGNNLVYTITVTNNGLSNAAAVSVADPTPSGLSFVSNTGNCTTAFPCSLGNLAPGATRTITSTYAVPASYTTPDPIVNTATASSTTADPVSANNDSTVSTSVQTSADLEIVKAAPSSVTSGNDIVYTVTVTNNGASDALAVSVADPTPAGLTFVSNTGNCTSAYPCSLGSVPAGATRTITSTYTVPASYLTPDPIENTATVSSATNDPVSANNTSTKSTTVNTNADLELTKSGPASVISGTDLAYTITVTNHGVSDAQAVQVADPLPSGLTFLSNTGDCTTPFPCVLGTLAAGATATITTTFHVPASYTTPNPIVNTATVSSTTTDPASGNNSDTESTPVTQSADVSILKLGPNAVLQGSNLTYTVVVTNNGDSNASNVSVADPTPSGLTFVSNTGDCTTTYPCSLGTLAPLEQRTITTTFFVPFAYTTPDPIVNTATVSSTTTDPVAANNSSTKSTAVTTVSADLSVVKTGPAVAVPGSNVVYTIVVTNTGPDPAPSTVLADVTPPGLTFVSNTGNCTSAFPCSFGTLASGATRTVTSTFSMPASYTTPDPIENTAFVTSDAGDPDGTDNTSVVQTPVQAQADLALTKTGPASVVAGQNVTYTITVTNGGASDASDVSVADLTPAGLTFVSNTGDCTTAFPCALGFLASGATRTITSTFAVSPSYVAPGPIVNTATVSATTTDPDGSDNSDSASTTVTTSADLAVVKTAPASVTPGTDLVYTVVVTNNGSSDAAAVSVADPTPAGLTFVSNTGDCTTAWPCALGTVAAGATRTITSTFSVPSGYLAPDPIVNTATVSSTTSDPTSANNSSATSTTVSASADVSIVKTGPASATPGQDLVYTVVVTNNGSSDAAAVSVADTTPTGLTFVSNTGNCTGAYPCSLGTIAAGATRTITTTYSVPASYTTPDPIVNTATVSTTTSDPSSANDSSTTSTPVQASADLTIDKNGPASVIAGNQIVYTVTVTNNGSSDAAAVSVGDTTPAGLAFVSNAGDCTTAYPCSLGTVPAGATRTITSTYTVSPAYAVPGSIVNTATVSSTTTDPDGSDNSDSATTSVTASADLSVVKNDQTDPVELDVNETYTITVTNSGPSNATGIVVTDTIDAATTYISNTGGCANSSGTLTCNVASLAAGASTTFTVTVHVPDTAPTAGTLQTGPCNGSEDICNNVSVTATQADPDPSDNSDSEPTDVEPLNIEGLRLAITDAPDPVLAGSALTYTLTYSNVGLYAIANANLTLTYDGATTFSSGSPAPTSGNFFWTIGSLAPGEVGQITVTVDVSALSLDGDTLVLDAELNGTHAIPADDSEQTHVRTDAPDHASLSVLKTVTPASTYSGGLLTYTITVTNDGPATAYGTIVSDPLPASVTYLSASPAPDVQAGNSIEWNAGDIASGQTLTYVVYVETDESLPRGTLIENAAFAEGTPGAGTVLSSGLDAEGSVVASVTGGSADCGVVARLRSMGIAQPDGEFVYRLLWNSACEDLEGAVLTQDLPPGLTFESLSSGDVDSYSIVNAGDHEQVVMDLGTVESGHLGVAFVRAHVDASITPGTDIVSTASLGDAAGRSFDSSDTSTVRDQSAIQLTRSYLRVTGQVRVIAGKTPSYVIRYRDVPPGTAMQISLIGGFTPLSFRPAPTSALPPSTDGTSSWIWTELDGRGRGVIRVRGIAHFSGPADGGNVISLDATAIAPDMHPLVKSGRDAGVLGPSQVLAGATAHKGKAVLKTQHFARGGSKAAVRLRYRKIVGSPLVTMNLPTFLEPTSFYPGAPASSTDNAYVWDTLPPNRGVVKVKMAIDKDLHEQESLAVGATVTDDFGTIAIERAKGAP